MSVIISPEGFQGSQRQQPQPHDLTLHRNLDQRGQNMGVSVDEMTSNLINNTCCPKCELPINSKQNRLVQDTCGHTKCRICLLKEETGCLECQQSEEQLRYTELRPPVIESYCCDLNPVDQRYLNLDAGFDCRKSVVELHSTDKFLPIQQQQPLNLISPDFRCPTPTFTRDKSPEVMFERLPCEKTVSLPFKKSLRFPKIDLNCQKQVLEKRLANAAIPVQEEPKLCLVEDKKEVEETSQENIVETERPEEATTDIPKESEVHVEQNEASSAIKTKKKRGKKAEPLPSHIQVQKGVKKSYTCNVCKRSFSTRANVHYHISCGSTEKPFECTQCGKGFISITHYKIHIRSHSGKRPFVCVYCNKDFAQKGKLRRHMMLHTGERPYCCEICGKGFRDHNALTKHNAVHSDERLFPCTKCEKRFKDVSNLTKHMVVHTKDKPYMCEQCGKSFGFNATLSHHKLIHTRRRDHACKICDMAFRLKRDLGRHMAIHSDRKPYKCPLCDIPVRRKDNLERHIRNTHPNAGKGSEAREKPNSVPVINATPAAK
ncbi:Hypothetical predicted protein [Cloeon dipterum]|uniref:C2H2-type domain-containing protein n=2 Tax=Cloeon dipterum TaxID=197152 RepID=A0A8S1DH79_9INSE|nr:Hypothetical predicted protein [Cloeon dipterum]